VLVHWCGDGGVLVCWCTGVVMMVLTVHLVVQSSGILYCKTYTSGSIGREFEGVHLLPLVCWDRGFQSHWGNGCLSLVIVVCCKVEVFR